jgi:serine/threonine protein kinase
MNNHDNLKIFEYFKIRYENIERIGKSLGRGDLGEVREIIIDNKVWAGKLIEKEKGQNIEKEIYDLVPRGKNIIDIKKIISSKIENKNYYLFIMRKAVLRDIDRLNVFFHTHNLLKVLYNPFDEDLGDNLLRFYAKQIINALELLDRKNLIHNNLKPQNILITLQLIIKLSGFNLLRKAQDNKTKIPEGTPGYLSPEYYINEDVDSEVARKQDYFALGSILYFLKYGKRLLKYSNNSDRSLIADEIVDLLNQKRENIKLGKMSDGEFINFLCSLIGFKPEDRPCFEEIYRNIWLNKNSEQINNIQSINPNDGKLIMELQKSDFLIKKEKEKDINSENKNRQKNKDNKNIKTDIFKKKKNNKLCRFRFKKRTNN